MFAVGALGAVLYTQSGWFDPAGRREAEREAEGAEEARARAEAAQPPAAEVTVTAREGDAAVWLLLGRTPLDSMPLSTAAVHELRIEHEGYRPLDVRVADGEWKEADGGLRARVDAELIQGAPRRAVPAYPAEAAGGAAQAPKGRQGRGVVRVESRPPGAQVWLLVGFTPRATVGGLEAGRDYELKVLKDGFRPGFAAVRSADWYLSGPGGPMLTSVTREVALAKARRPRSHRRGRSKRSGGDRD
jgi:hypothetical protein